MGLRRMRILQGTTDALANVIDLQKNARMARMPGAKIDIRLL